MLNFPSLSFIAEEFTGMSEAIEKVLQPLYRHNSKHWFESCVCSVAY